MNRKNDLTGMRFGSLTAAAPTGEKKNGYTVWLCRCDCGGEIAVPSRYLKNGWTTDCGCREKEKRRQDLTGQRFGRLTVLEDTGRTDGQGHCLWRCRCDCGREVETISNQLTAGYKKSCGCLSHPPLKDWIGERFGSLEVLAYAGKREGSHYWRCRCICGKEIEVRQSNLQSGHTKSCGCQAQLKKNIHFVDGTCVEQLRSRKLPANNTSGVRGVYRDKRRELWASQITFQGKTTYLGGHRRMDEAVQARLQAEEVFDDFLARYDSGYYD